MEERSFVRKGDGRTYWLRRWHLLQSEPQPKLECKVAIAGAFEVHNPVRKP